MTKDCEFKSQHPIQDGPFITSICCEIVLKFEKTEGELKRGRDDTFTYKLLMPGFLQLTLQMLFLLDRSYD